MQNPERDCQSGFSEESHQNYIWRHRQGENERTRKDKANSDKSKSILIAM
jgi:hypothetical protein